MEAEALFYGCAMRRVYRGILVLGALGTLVCVGVKGWAWGLTFLFGAAASYFNFSWLHQAVESMGPDARPTRKRLFVFVALRYALLGAGGYVIVRVFGMSAIGALIGLCVPVAAVTVEILYELVHAGT